MGRTALARTTATDDGTGAAIGSAGRGAATASAGPRARLPLALSTEWAGSNTNAPGIDGSDRSSATYTRSAITSARHNLTAPILRDRAPGRSPPGRGPTPCPADGAVSR